MDLKDYEVGVSDAMREALAIADRIRDGVPIPPAVREAQAISDSIREAFEVSCSLGETTSRLISERCGIIGTTAIDAAQKALQGIAMPTELQRLMDDFNERMERAANVLHPLSAYEPVPISALLPALPERVEPVLYDPPALKAIPQRQTPAAETIETIVEMWEQRRRGIEGTNQDAFVRVTPPDGRAMLVQSLAAQGDNLIVIRGQVATGEVVSITVGATAFQVEIVTLDKPPKKPDLRIVD